MANRAGQHPIAHGQAFMLGLQITRQHAAAARPVGGDAIVQQTMLALHFHQPHRPGAGVGHAAGQLTPYRRRQANAHQRLKID